MVNTMKRKGQELLKIGSPQIRTRGNCRNNWKRNFTEKGGKSRKGRNCRIKSNSSECLENHYFRITDTLIDQTDIIFPTVNNYPDGDCVRVVFEPAVFHPLIDPISGELDVKRGFPRWRLVLCFSYTWYYMYTYSEILCLTCIFFFKELDGNTLVCVIHRQIIFRFLTLMKQ